MKLPSYTRAELLEPYLAQVQLTAWYGGWDTEEVAVLLAVAIEGKALQTLLDFDPAERLSCPALTKVLKVLWAVSRGLSRTDEG